MIPHQDPERRRGYDMVIAQCLGVLLSEVAKLSPGGEDKFWEDRRAEGAELAQAIRGRKNNTSVYEGFADAQRDIAHSIEHHRLK